MRSQQQGFMRVKAVRAGHHIQPGVQHIRQVVHAATVRQRRGVQHGVATRHRLHRAEIRQRAPAQLAGTQHHTLGLAGGAAGVEQPGRVVVLAGLQWQFWAFGLQHECAVSLDGCTNAQVAQCLCESWLPFAVAKSDARFAVLGDPCRFAFVQLGVDGYRHRTSPPDAPHQGQIFGRVVQEQHHAVAGLHTLGVQPAGRAGSAVGEFGVIGPDIGAVRDGRLPRVTFGGARQPESDVHVNGASMRCDQSTRPGPCRHRARWTALSCRVTRESPGRPPRPRFRPGSAPAPAAPAPVRP